MEINESGNSILAVELLPATRTNFREELSLNTAAYGTELLPKGTVLMEIKCSGGIPLWMTHVLSGEKIYRISFSKYGTAYQTMIFPKRIKEEVFYA